MAATRSSAADLQRNGSNHLRDHAATAALYVTDPMRKRRGSETTSRDLQNEASPKLSPGLTLANASAAASLAHANRKTTSPWRPAERQPYAEKAAAFVRSYQSPEPPTPTKTNPDVYKAALLATQERVYTSSPPAVATTTTPTTPATAAAATTAAELRYDQAAYEHAMSGGRREPREATTTTQINPGALTAATGAVSGRRRTESAPTKPMFHPDAAYALTAATISHKASQDAKDVLSDLDPSMEAARIHHIARTNALLYTSTPPVEIEVEEQKHKDTLRAAAISMARDMYATSAAAAAKDEPTGTDFASSAAQNRLSHRYSQSQFSWAPGDEYNAPQRTPNLHEAAQKIATEKLAKMQKNDLDNKQLYYGTGAVPKSRQSLTRRLKRRTSSEGDASQIDWERSEQIRNQMSSLQNRLHQIDEKKTKDRADLMEIARKNVNAAIHDMDERVYAHTGKPSPNMQREWEERAQERARQETEMHQTEFGRVSIGGQKYMDQSEVEAIARSRIQPTLDEISTRVEEQRAREVEQQLEQERNKRKLEIEREREADLRAEEKQRKAGVDKENDTQMNRSRSTKGRGNLFARTSRVILRRKTTGDANRVDEGGNEEGGQSVTSPRSEQISEQPAQAATASTSATDPAERTAEQGAETTEASSQQPEAAQDQSSANPQTSPKSGSKLGSWFRGRISRRFSKPPPPEARPEENETQDTSTSARQDTAPSLAISSPRAAPLASNPVTESDLAPAAASGAASHPEEDEGPAHEGIVRQWSSSTEQSAERTRGASSPSEPDSNRRRRIRLSLRDILARKPPSGQGSAAASPLASPTMTTSSAGKAAGTTGSASSPRPGPTPRMNTMERNELHDSFTEESLPPPPTLWQESSRRSVSSSARDSKFSEDL